MNTTTAKAIIDVAMWLGVSAAIVVGILATGKVSPLWFFIIPLFVAIGTEPTSPKDNK